MRHQKSGKKLNRNSAERKYLYKNLIQSLFLHERMRTTVAKAKAIRPVAEKLLTRARKHDLVAYRALQAYLPDRSVAQKVFREIAPRFVNRPGGYIRIIKLGLRPSDQTPMAIVELTEKAKKEKVTRKKEVKKPSPKKD